MVRRDRAMMEYLADTDKLRPRTGEETTGPCGNPSGYPSYGCLFCMSAAVFGRTDKSLFCVVQSGQGGSAGCWFAEGCATARGITDTPRRYADCTDCAFMLAYTPVTPFHQPEVAFSQYVFLVRST